MRQQHEAFILEVQEIRKSNNDYHKINLALMKEKAEQANTVGALKEKMVALESELRKQWSVRDEAIKKAVQPYHQQTEQLQKEIEELNWLLDANRTEIEVLTRNVRWVKLALVSTDMLG